MFQEILVAAIVLIAVIVIGKRFWTSFRRLKTGNTGSCGCGCSNCSDGPPVSSDCSSTTCEAHRAIPGG